MELRFKTPEKYAERADKFFQAYELIKTVLPTESNKKYFKPKTERKCRFCGLSMPDVTFKSNAHLIPHLLGNNVLFSDFECDGCNKLFGTYEDHFAKMIEPERALSFVRAKEKYPKFKSPGKEVQIKSEDFYDNRSVQISRNRIDNSIMSLDVEQGKMVINFKKHSYSLNKVYKLFLKLALSVIPEDELLKDYRYGLEYILGKRDGQVQGCRVTGYSTHYGFNFPPHMYLFKKRDLKAKVPTHVLVLYCLNYIFSIPVLLNQNDFVFYNQTIKTIDYPPLFLHRSVDFEKLKIQEFYEDFTSDDLIKGLEQQISFDINKDELMKMRAFDPKTGEHSGPEGFNPNEIVSVILVSNQKGPIDFTKGKD